jgi:hypothetical protein
MFLFNILKYCEEHNCFDGINYQEIKNNVESKIEEKNVESKKKE